MKSVMIDFETFGTSPDACIVQVGACYFDPNTGAIGATFKRNIDARSSVQSGAIIDADTVYWWLGQSPEAQVSITTGLQRLDIFEAFDQLNAFLEGAKEIWSHATFDFVILSQTMKRLLIEPKFKYYVARDIRTLTAIAKPSMFDKNAKRDGVHHDALDDCKHQVKYVCKLLNRIRINE